MSATVAMTPTPAPHDRSSYAELIHSSPSSHSKLVSRIPGTTAQQPGSHPGSRTGSSSGKSSQSSSKPNSFKTSPKSSCTAEVNNSITVKKEPLSSPEIRHRPQKLDLSVNNNLNSSSDINGSYTSTISRPLAGQLTGRIDGLGIQEVGLACLSPGFNTQDPTMRDHLQKSLSVREQQRTLIEARMNKQSCRLESSTVENTKDREASAVFGGSKTPATTKRKAPPPGLSIVTPSHEEFAQERVIQSAPLNQSFTTGRYQPQPLTRHVANQPSNLSNTSHIHHVDSHPHTRSPANAPSTLPTTTTTSSSTPANTSSTLQLVSSIQSGNRLPPLVDIFGGEHLALRENLNQSNSTGHLNGATSNSTHNSRPPFPSPSRATIQAVHPGRSREYRSAEEAQAELSGGRPELMPKIVHYGGHQPPTPPSPRPMKTIKRGEVTRSGSDSSSSRRRLRAEYEEGASPPLGNGPSSSRRTRPFGDERDSPMSAQMKREQFIRLCAEAWDLFHS